MSAFNPRFADLPRFRYEAQKAQGVNGGDFLVGNWRPRQLSTEIFDTAGIASLSYGKSFAVWYAGGNLSATNSITLGASTYTFRALVGDLTADGDVLLGADLPGTIANLKAAVNRAAPDTNQGVIYNITAANATVESTTTTAASMLFEAKVDGETGATIACAESGGGAFINSATTFTDRPGVLVPAGTYLLRASAPATQVASHVLKIHNSTAGADIAIGTTEYCSGSIQTRSEACGIVTLTVASRIELLHRCTVTKTGSGFGTAANFTGMVEIYASLEGTKLA